MPTSVSCARKRLAASVAALVVASAGVAPAQSTHDVSTVLARVGERIERYYQRLQNIICLEKVTALPVGSDMSPSGFARVLEYEIRVETDGVDAATRATAAKVVRDLRKVNGRAPRPKDKEGCFDPDPLSTEPLEFLLAANRGDYVFSWAGFAKAKSGNAMLIDFRPTESGKPEIREHERGRDDCFSISMPGSTRGRIWVDPDSHDVLRLEQHLVSQVEFRVPFDLQRRHNLPDHVVLSRYDWAIKFAAVTFENPDETVLLPESIEELTLARGAGSHRTRQVFSDYRRFMTGARVVK